LCFLVHLAFLRLAVNRTNSVLSWVVSRGHLYGVLWADSITRLCEEGRSNSCYSPISAWRVIRRSSKSIGCEKRLASLPQFASNLQENHVIETIKKRVASVSLNTAMKNELKKGTLST
jgi:hypothetical protein